MRDFLMSYDYLQSFIQWLNQRHISCPVLESITKDEYALLSYLMKVEDVDHILHIPFSVEMETIAQTYEKLTKKWQRNELAVQLSIVYTCSLTHYCATSISIANSKYQSDFFHSSFSIKEPLGINSTVFSMNTELPSVEKECKSK